MSLTKAEKLVNLVAIQVPHGKTQSSSIGVRNRTTKVPVKDYSAATVPITG